MEIPTVPGDKVQIGHGPITCRSRADHVPIQMEHPGEYAGRRTFH